MNKCEQNRDKISLFVGQELDPDTEKELQAHLEDCQHCSREVAFLRGFQRKVAEAEEVEYPEGVHSRLLAALEQEKSESKKVVEFKPKTASLRFKAIRYLAAAAILCVCGLGVTQMVSQDTTPDAVASLVDHHDTCWHIAPSEGRDAQFQAWVEKIGKMPPSPTVSSELVAFDQRECPAGEVRAGHLLYHKGEQKVSVYILPAAEFTESYGAELTNHKHNNRNVVLKKKGDWVYGAVAELPQADLERLVDMEHLSFLGKYLAGVTEIWG